MTGRYHPRPRWAVVSFLFALQRSRMAREQLMAELVDCAVDGRRGGGA